ncbi:MAG: tetratricopeptide repeat protein [Deltaproteobacteria bacterium]|nr:tetratricopeptide repeat protein [Deltaproteobacteria bacterium]
MRRMRIRPRRGAWRRRSLAAISAFVLATLGSGLGGAGEVSCMGAIARADTPPSHWDRARDPDVGAAYKLHVSVQRRLSEEDFVERFRPFSAPEEAAKLGERDKLLRYIQRQTEQKKPVDLRLRLDLGRIYLELGSTHGRENFGKAVSVLKAALESAPDHPAAENAWLDLAFACGHVGDHVCERKAYVEVLRRETEDLRRATPSLNLAETEMHLGNLVEAVALYRETLRLAGRFPSGNTAALAVWGLAVALDRSGDSVAAEKEARFALELERSMNHPRLLRSQNVFFVPAYEIHWYEGLGWSAAAKTAPSPAESLRLWRLAEASFASYVRLADSNDRWLALANVRLANAKAAREAAEKLDKLRPKRPAPEAEDAEDTTL